MAKMIRSMARLSWLCLVFAMATSAAPVNIGRTRLFLGNGTVINGTGTTAQLDRPEGCTVDSSGTLYVAEANAHVLRRVNPTTAAMSVFLGTWNYTGHVLGGNGTQAQLATPLAMRFAPSGTLAYVVDYANNNIYSVNVGTSQTMTLFVGRSDNLAGAADGVGASAELNQPWDLTVHTNGTMFVTEATGQRVRRIEADGTTTHFSGVVGVAGYVDGAATTAQYNSPHGVAVSSDSVYVADTNNFVIRKVPIATQVSTTLAGNQTQDCIDGPVATARFKKPWGMALDLTTQYLYVADKGCNTVRRIDLTQQMVDTVVGSGTDGWTSAASSVDAQISSPNGVCLYSSGANLKLYVTGDNAVSVVGQRAVRTVTLTLAASSNGSSTTSAATTTQAGGVTTTSAGGTTAAPHTNATTSGSNHTTTPAPPTTTRNGTSAGNVTTLAPEGPSVSAAMPQTAVALAALIAAVLAVVL